MRQIAMVVEGQTEESFVAQVLGRHLATFDTYVTPIVVETSRAASGEKRKGGGRWSHYRRDITRLLGEPQWDMVTTMIDFYGYPRDAPGADCRRPHKPRDCAESRITAMDDDIGDARFGSFVMLHEFETLVFGASIGRAEVLGSAAVASALQGEVDEVDGDVEMLNDSPSTAPSKRLLRIWPDYAKVTDGVAVVEEAGLASVMDACPGFARWVRRLERAEVS